MKEHNITTVEELYSVYKQPGERAVQKEIPKLDRHCRHFISLSPFLVLSTDGGDGTADASPSSMTIPSRSRIGRATTASTA